MKNSSKDSTSTFWQSLLQNYVQQNSNQHDLKSKTFSNDQNKFITNAILHEDNCNSCCSANSGKESSSCMDYSTFDDITDDTDMISQEIDSSGELKSTCRLQGLLANEKRLTTKIEELESKERAYKEILTRADEKWAQLEQSYKSKLVEVGKNAEETRQKFEDLTKKLTVENAKLHQEIENIKNEMRECVRQAEEPLSKQIYVEKCDDLEKRLAEKVNEDAEKPRENKGVKNVGYELGYLHENVREVNADNEQIKKEMGAIKSRYEELKNDMMNKKHIDCAMLQKLSAALINLKYEEN